MGGQEGEDQRESGSRGLPSALRRREDRDSGCGERGEGLPPLFGAPDAVNQHEDEDDEQEPHDSSQAHQPGLRAVLRGCPDVEQVRLRAGARPGV